MAKEAANLSVWKVIGGAAAGVAVVAAAPVAAPVALGLGALSGGLLGAVIEGIGSKDKAFLDHKYKEVLSSFEETGRRATQGRSSVQSASCRHGCCIGKLRRQRR